MLEEGSETATRQEAATELIRLGFHVLAVQPGEKRPDRLLAPRGFLDATTDTSTAAGWWNVKPSANIGVACGADYGLVVLDVDVKNGANGLATLRDLGCDFATRIADTPSGGYHLYFKHPGQPLVPTLPGIDIKGADGGGYVLAPPSTLPNGSYRWRDPEMPVAEMPGDLVTQLRKTRGIGTQKSQAKASPVERLVVPEGRRHSRLVELGAIYRGKGLAPDEIETLLWEHACRYFDPPFSRDRAEDVVEIDAIVRWYCGKTASHAGDAPLRVLTTADLIAAAEKVSDRSLLEPILPEAGNLMVYGPTGAGKSHLATAIALAVAMGKPLLDWVAHEAVTVLFCDGEMPLPELKARLVQYLRGAAAPGSLLWAAARAQDEDMPNLADPAAQARYDAAIESCGARVVIFDNLTCLRTTTSDAPENSSEAWAPVANFLRRLNSRGIATITVHHASKGGDQRGSSAHTAVMDTVIKVAPPGQGQADPLAELDVEIQFDKHRRFGADAAKKLRAKVFADADGFAEWRLVDADPLAEDVARLHTSGKSIREIARALRRSKNGIQQALDGAKARGLVPLPGSGAKRVPPE